MGVERYAVEAMVGEGRSRREIARSTGLSKAWVDKLVARYCEGGLEALTPRSRRPKSCPHAASPKMQAAVIELRHHLGDAGLDNGPHTVAHHLRERFPKVPSVATIWRILKRHGEITPQPQKRPKSSFIRFEAALPNEMWQGDTTHWRLADGSDVETSTTSTTTRGCWSPPSPRASSPPSRRSWCTGRPGRHVSARGWPSSNTSRPLQPRAPSLRPRQRQPRGV